ncbi:MAG TPA: hypothetical protein DEA08_32890, partial [Planctomycetes bacterium]|nr:hypothetical protein [Planctomycetota bacterium]
RLSRRGLLIERGYPTKVVTIPYDQLEIVEAAPRGIQLATQENAYKAWSRPLFVPTDSPAEQEELLARLEHAKLGELGDLPALPRYKEIPEQYPRPLPLRILGAAGLQLVVFFGTPLVYSHPIAYFLVVMSVLLQFVLCWLPWWRRTTQPYHALLIHDYLMHHRWEWPLAEVTALRRTGGWALLHYEADQPPLRLWLGTGPKAGSALRAALPHLPCQEGGPYEEGWDNVGEEGRYLVWSWVAVAVVVASSWLWGPALLG